MSDGRSFQFPVCCVPCCLGCSCRPAGDPGQEKQPKKPVAILAAVSVAVALVSFVVVGVTYQPTPEQIAERERIAAEKEERERLEAEEAARAADEAAQAEAEEAARREAEEAARAESVAPSESQTPEPSTSVPASAPSEPPAKPEASTKPSTNDAPSTPPDSEEDGTGSDGEDFITAHKSDIIVASKMTLDNYVSGYKIPLAPSFGRWRRSMTLVRLRLWWTLLMNPQRKPLPLSWFLRLSWMGTA